MDSLARRAAAARKRSLELREQRLCLQESFRRLRLRARLQSEDLRRTHEITRDILDRARSNGQP